MYFKGITLTTIFFLGSGVVTRRPLILQLVHTPPKNKTTTSKKSAKEEKPKGLEDDEEGEACKCKLKLPYLPQGDAHSINGGRRGLTYLFGLKICMLSIFFLVKRSVMYIFRS